MITIRNLSLLCMIAISACGDQQNSVREEKVPAVVQTSLVDLTADDILDRIKDQLTCDWAESTVDTYKGSSGGTTVTGIATTFLATQEVLQKAAQQGLNMVITHEPTFYNHLDDVAFFEGDPVYEAKQKVIDDHKMVVLRFHDHWHRTRPDGIHVGMIRELEWKNYQVKEGEMVFKLPPSTLGELAEQLQRHFSVTNVRVVGDPNATFTQVGLAVGAPGSESQIRMLRRDDVSVLITGESTEWTTVEYVRDAQTQGKDKHLILLGHASSEEAGMAYCAEWLETFISEVPIKFIEAGNPIWTPDSK